VNGDIELLIEKATQSLDAAELLRQRGYFDFAASRAYYAMFYVAEALLASLGQSYSTHGAVQAAYGREFAKTGRLDPKFHRWLIDAQDFRSTGDYETGVTITPEQAAQICEWAREFGGSARSYLTEQRP
jgi:uncharacterized protein (UPF0332 family)